MATYANPYAQGRPIKTRGSTIANGIARMAQQAYEQQSAEALMAGVGGAGSALSEADFG